VSRSALILRVFKGQMARLYRVIWVAEQPLAQPKQTGNYHDECAGSDRKNEDIQQVHGAPSVGSSRH
jgi:hypothetical protein